MSLIRCICLTTHVSSICSPPSPSTVWCHSELPQGHSNSKEDDWQRVLCLWCSYKVCGPWSWYCNVRDVNNSSDTFRFKVLAGGNVEYGLLLSSSLPFRKVHLTQLQIQCCLSHTVFQLHSICTSYSKYNHYQNWYINIPTHLATICIDFILLCSYLTPARVLGRHHISASFCNWCTHLPPDIIIM